MSSKTPKTFNLEGVTDRGRVVILNREAMLEWAALVGDGIELVGELRLAEETRSLRASNYYWAVVIKAAVEHSGQPADDVHDFWCAKFIPSEQKHLQFFHKMTGEKIEADVDTRRSSKLNRAEFYDYVEACRQWLIDFLGVSTPDPDKSFWRKSKEGKAA